MRVLSKIRRRGLIAIAAGALFVLAGTAGAEEKKLEIGKWYPSMETGVTLTQSTFSDNWAGGDKGSVVWTAILNGSLENQLKEELNWSQVLKLAYGQTHQQVSVDGERSWQRPEKSTDLVDYETIMRVTKNWIVDPYASARFESQFQDASDPMGRTLAINPLKFKESGGVAKKFIDEEERSLLTRFGFTFRQSSRKLFVSADKSDKSTISKSTNDGGIEWVTDYKAQILNKRVTWTSKLNVYQPIFYSGKSDLESLTAEQLTAAGLASDIAGYTTAADLDWENIFVAQITKLLSVNLYFRWIYDKYDNTVAPIVTEEGGLINPSDVSAAIRKAGQFKQTLSLGITYRVL